MDAYIENYFRSEETNLTGFDWLMDHQKNFESNQKDIEKRVRHTR